MKIERRPIINIEEWLAWRRTDVLTASRVAGLFGLHPRETPYSLFQRAHGVILPEDEGDVTSRQRGLDFEDLIGRRFQREHPELKLKRAGVYLRDPVRKFGGTPDFFLRSPAHQRGVLECKSVAPFVFKKYWTEYEPPRWIIMQTLVQMMLAQATFGWIAACIVDGYRYDLHCYEVPRHAGAERRILDAIESFWHCVENNKVPEPDYARDGALIAAMNQSTTEGKTVDLRHDNRLPEILDERARLKQEIDDAKARCEEIENEIRGKIGDAEAALVTGWRLTCKEIKESVVKEYTRKAYRQLRATRDEAPAPATSEVVT
jgi:predicted phage-related endonuclease